MAHHNSIVRLGFSGQCSFLLPPIESMKCDHGLRKNESAFPLCHKDRDLHVVPGITRLGGRASPSLRRPDRETLNAVVCSLECIPEFCAKL